MNHKEEIYQKTKASYAFIADDYIKKHSSLDSASKKLTRFLDHLPPGAAILDAGCGHGRDLVIMNKLGFQAIGIDSSAEMIRYIKEQLGLKAFEMDLNQINLPGQRFDGIWACAALHHLPSGDVAGVIQSFYELLNPGGILYILVRVDCPDDWDEEYPGHPRYYNDLRRTDYNRILQEAGFILDDAFEEQKQPKTWLNLRSHKA